MKRNEESQVLGAGGAADWWINPVYMYRELQLSAWDRRKGAISLNCVTWKHIQTRGDKIAPYSCSFHTFKVHKNNLNPLSIIKYSEVCRLYTPAALNRADSLNTELKMPNEDDAKCAAEKEAAAKAAAEEERKRQARADVTKGLLDETTAKQLSSSGDDARRRRGK